MSSKYSPLLEFAFLGGGGASSAAAPMRVGKSAAKSGARVGSCCCRLLLFQSGIVIVALLTHFSFFSFLLGFTHRPICDLRANKLSLMEKVLFSFQGEWEGTLD